jgi:1-acyl-sn-glycerol-3-phosphate acyltransferase
MFFQPRTSGLENIPEKGGFIVISNHQSFLDPMFNATPIHRQCCFAARDTLFQIPFFGRFVHSFNAIPLKRGQADLTAMKILLEKLKDHFGLVLYPEGTRTSNGKIAEVKPGFCVLARRANVPVIPAVIDGGFECWPRNKKFYRPYKVYVVYGKPILPQTIIEMGDREFAKHLTGLLRDMQTQLRLRIGRKPYDYEDDNK